MRITLPYPPTTNHLYINRGNRRIKSPESVKFRIEVQSILLGKKVSKKSGTLLLEMHVYRPRRSGDLDNTIKATQDALTGIAWEDDSQVVAIHAYRHDDKVNPRVVVTVLPYTPVEQMADIDLPYG